MSLATSGAPPVSNVHSGAAIPFRGVPHKLSDRLDSKWHKIVSCIPVIGIALQWYNWYKIFTPYNQACRDRNLDVCENSLMRLKEYTTYTSISLLITVVVLGILGLLISSGLPLFASPLIAFAIVSTLFRLRANRRLINTVLPPAQRVGR